MLRAVPGASASGAMRRRIPARFGVPARRMGRCQSQALTSKHGGRVALRTLIEKFSFTQPLSALWVVCGRLGEVESLAGDCRPPPPGNPRQPPFHRWMHLMEGGRQANPAAASTGFTGLICDWQNERGEILPFSVQHSFKYSQFRSPEGNLKKFKHQQKFKIIPLFLPCTGQTSVLYSAHLHSHLCGLWVVEPPSIAITNVLEIG